MSVKAEHFCDYKDCGEHIAKSQISTCAVCLKEVCARHEHDVQSAFVWLAKDLMNTMNTYLPMCLRCRETYGIVLQHSYREVLSALQPIVEKTLEDLKLAHTAKALQE